MPKRLSPEQIKQALQMGQAAGRSQEEVFQDLAAQEGYAAYLPAIGPDVGDEEAAASAVVPPRRLISEQASQRLAALQPPAPAPVDTSQDPFGGIARRPATTFDPGAPLPPVVNIPDQPNVTPRMARQILAGGTSMLAAPLTAGMSLLPAAATEAGVVGGADLTLQGIRKLMQPDYEVNPGESMDIGLSAGLGNLIPAALLKGGQKLFAGRARIPGAALRAVSEAAPMGGPKAAKLIRPRAESAEFELAKEAGAKAAAQRAPSLPEAKAGVKAHQGTIDTTPIKNRILARIRAAVDLGEEAANKPLQALADKLPPKMTMVELDDYLRRIRRPVSEKIGTEGGTLMTQDVKDVQAFVKGFRDKHLTNAGLDAAVKAFARSEKEIGAIDEMKSLMLTPKGAIKRSDENTIRRVLGNHRIQEVFQNFDDVAKTDIAKRAKELAYNRLWSPRDLGDAGALTEMLAEVGKKKGGNRAASRAVAKAITIIGPRGGIPILSSAATAAKRAGTLEEKRKSRNVPAP